MTAGNLVCGFLATLNILQGALAMKAVKIAGTAELDLGEGYFTKAIWYILAACVFDLLDGRLARLGGTDSPFGREFDSLADVVSFGVAPALLVSRVLLRDYPQPGAIVASIYLVCGAMRLARFNCIAAANVKSASKDFKGIPIPAAAGLIASVTLFLMSLTNDKVEHWIMVWVLPPLLVFLSWMMFSSFTYPSFKNINWRTTRSMPKLLSIVVVILLTVTFYHWMPAVIFVTYLLYGFLRPFLSRKMKASIEEVPEDEDDEEETQSP